MTDEWGQYEGLAARRLADGWAHIDTNGKPVYRSRWEWVGNFQGGRCTVRAHGGPFHHIDVLGNVTSGPWDFAGDYREHLAGVRLGTDSFHIDPDGRPAYTARYADVGAYHKGYAVALDGEGWLHIDKAGRPCYKTRFRSAEPFYNGRARVITLDGRHGRIDVHGQLVEA